MDTIEYAIFCLAKQAEGIAEMVPDADETTRLLLEAGESLELAATKRHEHRASLKEPEDAAPAAQDAQLGRVEAELRRRGLPGVVINKGPRHGARVSPQDDQPPDADADLYFHYEGIEQEANERWHRMDEALGEVRTELSQLEGHRHQADKRVLQLSHECRLLRQALREDADYTGERLRDIAAKVPRS